MNKGILFIGEIGCGKTAQIKAVLLNEVGTGAHKYLVLDDVVSVLNSGKTLEEIVTTISSVLPNVRILMSIQSLKDMTEKDSAYANENFQIHKAMVGRQLTVINGIGSKGATFV